MQVVRGHIGSIIVCIAVAVVLIADLHGLDRDRNTIQRQILVFITSAGLHRTGDNDSSSLADFLTRSSSLTGRKQNALQVRQINACSVLRYREINSFQQLVAAGHTIDGNLILDSQITLVYDLESVQIKGRTGFPKNVCSVVLVAEIQCLALEGVAACIHDVNIQITCLDLVDVGGSRVGEPRERSAHQHDHTHGQRCDAGQQCAFGCLFVAHALVTPLQ